MYISTLSYGFTYDDLIHIVTNPYIRSWSGLSGAFSEPMFPGDLYRPLVVASYVLSYQLVELEPLLYHGVNILAHAFVVIVLFSLLRTVFSSSFAFVTSLLFALHPIHTETVTNISGRAELFAALFGLLSLLYAVRKDEKRSTWLSLTFFFMALLSKESALVFFPLLAVFAYYRGAFLATKLITYFLPLLAYLSLRFVAVGSLLGGRTIDAIDNPIAALPFFERATNALCHLFHYLSLLFVPRELSADYSFAHIVPLPLFHSEMLLPLIGIVVVFLLACVLLFYRKREGLFLAWFFVAFSITANVIIPIGTVFAERLAYLPSIGVVGVLTSLLFLLERRWFRISLISLLSLVFAAKGVLYQQFWENNELLFSRQFEVSPQSIKTKLNYAEILRSHQQHEQAREVLSEAQALVPRSADVLFVLGLVSLDVEEMSEAKQLFQRALRENPDHLAARNALARLYLNQQQYSEALREAQGILARNPYDEKALVTRFACALLLQDAALAQKTLHTIEALKIKNRDLDRLMKIYREIVQ